MGEKTAVLLKMLLFKKIKPPFLKALKFLVSDI